MAFILADISYASFAKPGKQEEYSSSKYKDFFDVNGPAWSHALSRSGTNQNTVINPTGPPGYCLGLYISLVFDLPKDGWTVTKVMETLDVTPVHHQYYELTHGRKEALEAKIREGLVKISQSIADLELVEHDLLKYEDFKEQLENAQKKIDEKAEPKEKEKAEEEKKKAEMALKTVFMEEVDYHAGGAAQGPGRLSMAFLRNHNIMPTVVDDFFRMTSKEDLKKDPTLKDLPKVEQRMLEVKWDAYQDWLGFFKSNVTRRIEALNTLKRSREKTLEEYREWLKPTIARHKIIVDSLESESARKGALSSYVRLNAMALSSHKVKIWFWKSFVTPDPHRTPQEEIEKSGVVAFDKWSKDNLYLHPDHGLITDYPWVTEKWILKNAGADKWGEKCSGVPHLSESEWYYSFQELLFDRTNFKTSATGSEGEDAEFRFANYMMSKNVLAAKYIELKAKEELLEIYIDDILGLTHTFPGKPVIIYKYDKKEKLYKIDTGQYGRIKKFQFKFKTKDGEKTSGPENWPAETSFKTKKELEKAYPKDSFTLVERKKKNETWETAKQLLGLGNIRFFLPNGPYEQNWSERIKKYYLKPNSARFEYVRNFLVSRMGIES